MYVSISVLIFSGNIPRGDIADGFIPVFFFLRNFHTVFHSGYINLHFHKQYQRVPFFPKPSAALVVVDF